MFYYYTKHAFYPCIQYTGIFFGSLTLVRPGMRNLNKKLSVFLSVTITAQHLLLSTHCCLQGYQN